MLPRPRSTTAAELANCVKPPKKKKSWKKKSSSSCCHSVSCGADELLLIAKAFMKVSTNVKHSTDKKAKNIWDEVYTTFEEFVAMTNKINKSHPEFILIEPGHGAESICNCWQCLLQPSIQQFVRIIYNNPPNFGGVRDDSLMDLNFYGFKVTYVQQGHAQDFQQADESLFLPEQTPLI